MKKKNPNLESKNVIFTAANIFAGAIDFFETLEKDPEASLLDAAVVAFKRGKKRAKAIAKANGKHKKEKKETCPCGSEQATTRCSNCRGGPFVLCRCGSGLSMDQCHPGGRT